MISVIIPAYNEARALPETLSHLFAQEGDFQVILVDGGSTDETRALAAAWPGVHVIEAPKGRGSQMNAGAARAQGEWLLFLHADTLLPPDALGNIARLGAEVHAGGFRHRFSGNGWSLRLISIMDNLRCRSTRIIYGDQAMFVRRRLFHLLGAFPEDPVLEDLRFCEKLVRVTRPVFLDATVVTDSRKFVKMGIWRSLARVAVILVCAQHRWPIPPTAARFFQDVR
ncbi:MAG: glycosyltransferase family 2 protein [Gammaproteobacteria bacterium]|nr:glycosyltransferase family 2 protein [Gammaproteobacteria bacterium]NIR82095.1 glycosyltransferase family 2 protein [Gammaproteobacteria bacterium]NIR89328.1 glycosyltransferase family 2 protein [Gammaproteobacteria bacterium]NIU03205.1 glycosyltransferase family 2 protein [Gammaproteobacteria bacterium]NIV74500.1 glycosyltransferase [Gammaproteobacteria bacterium]